jgi:flavin reductase (DIM6/NTAB) family NADH-FMN oxidoreductase RutF
MSSGEQASVNRVSAEDYKVGMRQLAASVNVIAVEYDGSRDGLTATAACSISAEPPQLLVSVNSSAGAHDAIRKAGAFSLNILGLEQEDIAKRFAGMDGAERSQRFGLGNWKTMVTGAPTLAGAVANFDCEVEQMVTAATHTIFIGRVVAVTSRDDGQTLLYGDGKFTGLAD